MSENNESVKKGGISVDSEHIFPVIKKWLYSEKEIFLREIVSNASDAITKLKRLSSLGEADLGEQDYRIDVILDKDAGTLTVSDNGIGMTGEELEKYICSIALSGAVDFIQKYEKDDSGKPQEGIIGHFGLGFYSAFMVSDTVTIQTRSYTDAPAVKWVCDSEGDYEVFPGDREERGTSVIMKISDEEVSLLSEYKIKEILEKYCAFMPIPIFFSMPDDAADEDESSEDEDKKEKKEPEQVNDTEPLWTKKPGTGTDEQYKEFYKKVFKDYRDPLFWIHINADYPLNFKGIVYFPKLNTDYEPLEGQIKLYYNQVFVADNIKEVIPEYMLTLRGVLDCPELPLNVSRSYLQNNDYITKISSHIVKKIGDKLNALFNTERENYEKLYDDIKLFVEYGCIRDKKFFDRVKGVTLFNYASGDKKCTLDEYLAAADEKHKNTVLYATDKEIQAQYISMFENEGASVLLLNRSIDTQFISTIETDRSDVKFMRVDAGVDLLKGDGEAKDDPQMTDIFRKVSNNTELSVAYAALKDETTPAVITRDEQERRFSDMMKMYRMEGGEMPEKITLTVNTSSALYARCAALIEGGMNDKAEKLCAHIYALATLSNRPLTAEEMKKFLADSYSILMDIE